MKKDNTRLSISEMSNICRISRQTLIYYDKHNIFKPDYIDANAYRYYSVYQIPFLREICALKDNRLPLKEIVENFENRSVDSVLNLLHGQKVNLQKDIEELREKLRSVEERMDYYRSAKREVEHAYQPYVCQKPARQILFCKWEPKGKMDRPTMHITHMKLRNRINDLRMTTDMGWGAMLLRASLDTDHPLEGAGAYVNLPADFTNTYGIPEENLITMPEGFYVCMGKYGMPYETKDIYALKEWIDLNNYTIIGDIFDECLLDTTFYTEDIQRDFCLLQVPIRMPGVNVGFDL